MATFEQLIKDSWKLAEEEQAATYIDEVFIGGLVSTMLESGHALFDVSSTGDYHNMMFENLGNQDRVIIRYDTKAMHLQKPKYLDTGCNSRADTECVQKRLGSLSHQVGGNHCPVRSVISVP